MRAREKGGNRGGLGVPTSPAQMPSPIPRRSLPVDAAGLAQWLLGKHIVRVSGGELMIGRIVETEAYLSDDPASHSFGGLTARNRSMFAQRGHAYVYRIYGVWFCLNVSAGAIGHGAAVLIRALEPQMGVEHMRARRGGASGRIARGPGRLCAALDIDLAMDGVDLCGADGGLWLARGDGRPAEIGVSTRIGITKAADRPLRFYERGNIHVSGPRHMRA